MSSRELPPRSTSTAWRGSIARVFPALARFAPTKTRRRLFIKYVALFVAVVCVALVTNASFEIWFFYQEHKTSLIRIQREQAEAVSAKIGQFVEQIEAQLGWTTQLPWDASTLEQ